MQKRLTALFLAAEGALYALYMISDLLRKGDTTPLKFIAIVLVAVMGLGTDRWVRLALLLTVFADLFLLVLDRNYLLGIGIFLAVQACYAVYENRENREKIAKNLLFRAIFAVFSTAFFWKSGKMLLVPAVYIVVFAINLAQAVLAAVQAQKEAAQAQKTAGAPPAKAGGIQRETLFAAGLALFFLCDLCVGAHNLPASLLPQWLPGFARVAMWGFYLPGQVLIVLSAGREAAGSGKEPT